MSLGAGEVLPVLPLRDIVVFPHMIVPLFVGREKSVRALEAVMKEDKQILLIAQKSAEQNDPSADDIYRVGTVSTILQPLKLPDGTVKVLVEGGKRARITAFKETDSYFEAFTEVLPDVAGEPKELEALGRSVIAQFEHRYAGRCGRGVPPDHGVQPHRARCRSFGAEVFKLVTPRRIPARFAQYFVELEPGGTPGRPLIAPGFEHFLYGLAGAATSIDGMEQLLSQGRFAYLPPAEGFELRNPSNGRADYCG